MSNISEDTGRNNELRRKMQELLALGIPEKDIKHPFEYRDYQEEALQQLFFTGYGFGMVEIPTAGGKSFMIANFIWNLWKNINRDAKVLILVPSTQLVFQFYDDLVDYGLDKSLLAKFTGSLKKKERLENNVNTAKIVIANRQQVFTKKSELPHFDVLFADEAHTCNAESTS